MAPPARQKPPASEYKTIAAQFAAAKRAKEKEDAARAVKKDDAGAQQQKEQKEQQKQQQITASAIERRRAARELRRKSAYERRWLWTAAFWVWLLAVHAAGILYFTSGFLLTRLVLDEQSTCAVSPLATADTAASGGSAPANHGRSSNDGCWHPKTFDRAVVLIIDALRYDFTVPVNDSAEFHNAFPFLYETAVAQPTHAFLRPFIADPPTTTLQRLKGLTTGTLPTFIDMGSNFAGTAIEEDSLLAQLRAADKKIAHLGDDTWTALFPGYFEANISRAYDSFNVWDLHTVDNGVMDHMMPLLAEPPTKWDVLIGHCLGVDHAGHRYGPSHAAMRAKLQQMDAFVRQVAAAIDDNTLLVVMGDHGMDSKGDHGGESDDEVEAALWMYARRPLFGRTSADPAAQTPPATAKEHAVNQIDLVPTLALLLGVPIPYNNLGWPIEEAFIGAAGKDWTNLAHAAEVTAAGIHRYQESYFHARGAELGAGGTSKILQLPTAAENSSSCMPAFYAALSQYQAQTLRICKDLWARFDVDSMVLGLVVSAVGVVVLLLYVSRSGDEDDDDSIALVDDPTLDQAEMLLELQGELVETPGADGHALQDVDPALQQQQQLHQTLVVSAVAAAVPAWAAGAVWVAIVEGDSKNILRMAQVGAAPAALASLAAVGARLLGSGRRRLGRLVPSSVWGWLAAVFSLAQSIGFASNSFTIWEDGIVVFFLATFGLVATQQVLRRPGLLTGEKALGMYHAVVFVVLGRVASLSRLCREEQMPFCTTTYYASATSSTSAPWQLAILFVVAIVLPALVRSFYMPTRSFEGLAPVWISGVFRGGLLLAAAYWTLDAIDNAGGGGGVAKTASVYVAQMTLGLALVAGSVAFVWAGPCVAVKAQARTGRQSRAQVAVLGYANAHGARYLLLPVNLLLAAVVLAKPMGGGALALMLWQVLSLVELLDVLNGGTSSAPDASSVSTPSTAPIAPVVLAMLAKLHYFTTGHQAVLSSIQWDSAFVPLFTIRYPWSPLAVVGNTFPGHLLAVAAVPLLVLWKTGPRQRGGLLSPTSRALAGFAAFFAVEALATMAWAGHLRRHLMLYRVFNPRFMLAAAALLLVDVAAILLALPGLRANTLAVSDVFGWVDDY